MSEEQTGTTVTILSFEPLRLELPEVDRWEENHAMLPLPIRIQLPEVRVTVRKLLGDSWRMDSPAIVGDMPGPAYTIAKEDGEGGEMELGALVEFIVKTRPQLQEVSRLYQEKFDEHGPLLESVL